MIKLILLPGISLSVFRQEELDKQNLNTETGN
jgi:hypothetical protein